MITEETFHFASEIKFSRCSGSGGGYRPGNPEHFIVPESGWKNSFQSCRVPWPQRDSCDRPHKPDI